MNTTVSHVLSLLRERICSHEDSRKATQEEIRKRHSELVCEINTRRNKMLAELNAAESEEETRILELVDAMRRRAASVESATEDSTLRELVLSGISTLQSLKTYTVAEGETLHLNVTIGSKEHVQCLSEEDLRDAMRTIYDLLSKAAEEQNNKRIAAANEMDKACDALIYEANTAKERVYEVLEKEYTAEDSRLQALVSKVSNSSSNTHPDEQLALCEEAHAGAFVEQRYVVTENKSTQDLIRVWNLKTVKSIPSFSERKVEGLKVDSIDFGKIYISFNSLFSSKELDALSTHKIGASDFIEVATLYETGDGKSSETKLFIDKNGKAITPETLKAETSYTLSVWVEYNCEMSSRSEELTFTTPSFSRCCTWKKNADIDFGENTRILVNPVGIDSFVVGSTPLPPGKVTSWRIKILKSEDNNGSYIYIGVAPSNINQNEGAGHDGKASVWFLSCYSFTLCSGPSRNYSGKEYGPRKERGKYVHTGDSVGVVMDTTKGELSFVVDGVNLGVAYDGIPLDKPLVPCVLLGSENVSVELDTSEVKETKVNSSISVPSNITTKSTTWDSVTLSWDAVEGASFYQIEVDGSKFWDAPTTSIFTKRGLQPDTEHNFRERAVSGNEMSEWSGVVKGRTQKTPEFSECSWKECPDYVDKKRWYSVDEGNPKIVKKTSHYTYVGYPSTIIGSAPIPQNKVTSWSIKILESINDNGENVYIGVAPFDINQNHGYNYNTCGWYFHCFNSVVHSGPPHNYNKAYGPRKERGKYVHTGDSVGVVMDTTKGELSFAVNGVNLGVAYDGIPLDKPLVPCVLLRQKGESVELII